MMEMKKILVVGIIFLFIGVAIAPSINLSVVKASNEDLVEVTTQACGIKGFGNTTVKLTREQFAEVEDLLDDIQTKLDATKTMVEAISIYHDAIVELNKYGLLPEGMNVETAQKLVTGDYKHQEQTNLLRVSANNLTNALCLVVGKLPYFGGMYSYGPLMIIFLIFAFPIINFLINQGIYPLIPFIILLLITYMIDSLPIGFMNTITLGDKWDHSTGEISTVGILGKSSIKGAMIGEIVGFTGLKLMYTRYPPITARLLGFSLFTHIQNI
jgi:uncharacterized protein YoxC